MQKAKYEWRRALIIYGNHDDYVRFDFYVTFM